MADVERSEVAGREHLTITAEELRIELVPALGGTIVSLVSLRHPDTELLWRPPWGLRPAAAATLPDSAAMGSFDSHVGGWQTMFPNGSESAVVEGANWPAYGEARLAWCDWQQTGSSVILTSRLLRSPFQVTKIISVQDDEVTLGETVKNVGEQHVDVVWGALLMFGSALLGPSSRFDARAALVRPDARRTPAAGYDDILPWPRSYAANGLVNLRTMPEPGSAASRTAYLSDFSAAEASLTNADLGLRVDLGWDGDVWPYLWYDLQTGGQTGYPWWGAARYLALTPCTSWPAAGIDEIRRVSATSLRIQPGSTRTTHLSVRISAV